MEHVFENNLLFGREPNVILIMAGGLGKRMNSDLPKVLHKLDDIPLITHVVNSALQIDDTSIIYIIVGKYKDQIEKAVITNRRIKYIDQPEPLGTGNAIQCCKEVLQQYDRSTKVLILSGDVPLFSTENMREILNRTFKATIVTTSLDNPFGYGRIIGSRIVEEKDCTNEEKLINAVNCGIYAFENETLCKNLPYIMNDNAQKEYYLTSIFLFVSGKIGFFDIPAEKQYQVRGINTPEQLEEMRSKTV